MKIENPARAAFSDPAFISTYVQDTPRKVPGLSDLHRMTMLLLSEQAGQNARILVVGAGGGLELKAFAEDKADWTFTGVDPSTTMLELARHLLKRYERRIDLIEGKVDATDAGSFDGATCLLTLHFLDRAERLQTLTEIHRRLKPGARLVIAHHCACGKNDGERWLTRSIAFSERDVIDWAKAESTGNMMAQRLPLLNVTEEEALLEKAGFRDFELFYAALSFRGWVATA